jgi:hypothetical protein
VQIPVGRRAADPVVAGQLGQPGPVEKPAQHQHRLPVAAQRPPPTSGSPATALGGREARHQLHGLLGDEKHGGVADRIGHSRTSGGKTIREKTSLLPRRVPSDLPTLGYWEGLSDRRAVVLGRRRYSWSSSCPPARFAVGVLIHPDIEDRIAGSKINFPYRGFLKF